MRVSVISAELTHGMSPSQNSERALLGVPPERNFAQSPSRRSGQLLLLIRPTPQSFSGSFPPARQLPDSSRPVRRGRAALQTPSHREERAGRGLGQSCARHAPPLPGPLLHRMEERELSRGVFCAPHIPSPSK